MVSHTQLLNLYRQLDDDHIRYLDMRRLTENGVVVQYNPEIAILWETHHNVQQVISMALNNIYQ